MPRCCRDGGSRFGLKLAVDGGDRSAKLTLASCFLFSENEGCAASRARRLVELKRMGVTLRVWARVGRTSAKLH